MQAGILAQVADRDRVLGNVLKLLAATRERGVRTASTTVNGAARAAGLATRFPSHARC